jgi:hypothetical protein
LGAVAFYVTLPGSTPLADDKYLFHDKDAVVTPCGGKKIKLGAATGLGKLSVAERFIQTTGEHWYEAKVHRLRGKLLRVVGDNTNAVVSFRRAVVISQEQSAKLAPSPASSTCGASEADAPNHATPRPVYA